MAPGATAWFVSSSPSAALLATAGGVLGLAIGYAGVTLFRQFRIPTDLPITVSFELDRRTLIVSFAIALSSAVLVGLSPAMAAARADVTDDVMRATDAAGYGRRRIGRGLLVGGQVAVSVLLLAIATFVYRDFQQRFEKGPGFRTDRVLVVWFNPGLLRYRGEEAQRFFARAVERVRVMPGVTSAALTSFVPTDGGTGPATIVPEGIDLPDGRDAVALWSAMVDESFFSTLAIPILEGRAFTAADTAHAPRVAIVNEVVARHYWPGKSPIGKRFRLDNGHGPWIQIVGLAKTTTYSILLESPPEFIYFPLRQRPQPRIALLVETSGDPAAFSAPLRDVIASVDPAQPIWSVRTLDETYRLRTVTILTIIARLIGAMGVMGLVLAIVGLYGLVSYTVGRRTKEIGIRMAIGADRLDILRMVIAQGITLAAGGLAIGLLASAAAGRGLTRVFPASGQSRAANLASLLLVAGAVLAVTALAAYLPARRASQINPTDALRHE